MEFNKITAEYMKAYIEANAPEDKAWFVSVAFETRKEKKAVDVLDENGNPVYKQAKDKNGNLRFDADGKPVMRKAKKYVEKADGAESRVFNLLKAKRAFCARYMPELLPVAKEKKATAADMFAGW